VVFNASPVAGTASDRPPVTEMLTSSGLPPPDGIVL
jgi:hypothetical protein